MKLPSFRRLIKSDYEQEYSKLIETLSFSINNGIEVLYQALNKSLTLRDNIACAIKEIEVAVDSNGTPTAKTGFTLDSGNKILGITVLNVINAKNPSILPNSGVFISFVQETKNITIVSVRGLPPNQTFTLTLVAFES
jgi:hypothetical protein